MFFFFVSFKSQAQFYITNGTAVALPDSCYRITADINWQNGTVWNDQQIDLNDDFFIEFSINLGSNDLSGADGIVFAFQDVGVTALGVDGGSLGFGSFVPSIGVEFDTYYNSDFADPTNDHVALISNGVVNHSLPQNLAGPFVLSGGNIEDGNFHDVAISWNAFNQQFIVRYECDTVINYSADIINEVLNGNSMVYWGFAGATGGESNEQSVCIQPHIQSSSSSFNINLCNGENVQLNAFGSADGTYLWSPIDGLSNPNISNPIASPSTSTNYTVSYPDNCGNIIIDQYFVAVYELAETPNPQNFTICYGDSIQLMAENSADGTYNWQNGSELNDANIQNPLAYPSQSTTFIANYPDDCGNIIQAEFNITVEVDQPTAAFNAPTGCVGEELTFISNNNNQFWDFAGEYSTDQYLPSYAFSNAGQQEVTLIVYDDSYCIPYDTQVQIIEISPVENTQFSISEEYPAPFQEIQFINDGNVNIDNWNFGDDQTSNENNTSHFYTSPGEYEVCANENNLCALALCKTVTVIDQGRVIAPTAFSPNGNGQNDTYLITGTQIQQFNLRIYNRWGQLVFETNDINEGWDGKFKNEKQPVSVFVYVLEATFFSQETVIKSGNITLIR